MYGFALTESIVVVDSWCQSQPYHQSIQLFAHLTHLVFPVNFSNGRPFLHVLHVMEPVPNSTGSCRYRSGNVPERQSSITRGSRAKVGRPPISCNVVDRGRWNRYGGIWHTRRDCITSYVEIEECMSDKPDIGYIPRERHRMLCLSQIIRPSSQLSPHQSQSTKTTPKPTIITETATHTSQPNRIPLLQRIKPLPIAAPFGALHPISPPPHDHQQSPPKNNLPTIPPLMHQNPYPKKPPSAYPSTPSPSPISHPKKQEKPKKNQKNHLHSSISTLRPALPTLISYRALTSSSNACLDVFCSWRWNFAFSSASASVLLSLAV